VFSRDLRRPTCAHSVYAHSSYVMTARDMTPARNDGGSRL
jgi:hypothetical protein